MKLPLLFLLLYTTTAFAQVNMTLGLKAYYPFSGNANDISGNNNNPSFNNATLAADRFGNANSAYLFNGTNQYMRVPNSPSLNSVNQLSICAWVKVSGFYQGPCHGNNIVMKGDADYLPGNYMIRYDDGPYTNGQNCVNPVPDIAHENFFGMGTVAGAGYTPYVQTGQWMSVVYTNDGITAKLYVNCELKISGSAAGIGFTNSHDLFLGKMNHPSFPYWFNGVMDEVRIYNRALNLDEVKVYGGCASFNANPIGGIINDYTPVISLNPCDNKITVENATAYNPGDTVLIIQMKGALVDTSNSLLFGTVMDYKSAGHYEINYVKSKTGNIIELKNNITRQYDLPNGKVQLVRMPYYSSINVTMPLTCLPWDGNKGGVLVFNCRDTLNLQSNIDVSGKGFRGGNDPVTVPSGFNCYENQYYYPPNADLASEKGEGIAIVSAAKSFGKGKLANGGGGGNSHNSGGGGGGNLGAGGFGGYNFEGDPCNTTVPFDNRGLGGHALSYGNSFNKIFLGGGGGAGHSNNPQGFMANGGNGGGIIIIMADKVQANGFKIMSNGLEGTPCGGTGPGCHEGMGGGGAGGTTLLKVNSYIDNTVIEAKGGKGGDMTATGFLKVGPGGGGGFGAIWITPTILPSTLMIVNAGGQNGVCTGYANNAFGATPGVSGSWLIDLKLPIDSVLFKTNIDSVRINDSLINCNHFDFKGLGYVNSSAITNWQWDFGDGGFANTQNANHVFAAGTYTVKLVVTDINGCRDSVSKNITASALNIDAGNASTICSAGSVTLSGVANGTNPIQYNWTPAAYLNNPSILNPVASPPVTTMFYLDASNPNGCAKRDSVLVTVRSTNSFTVNPPVNICSANTAQLLATGGDLYSWQPSSSLDNPVIYNPIASPTSTTTYTVQITDTLCSNTRSLTTTVTVLPKPMIKASKSNDLDCSNPSSQLNATGGVQYVWTPASTLTNPNSNSPVATPLAPTRYTVMGKDISGCINYDSVLVDVTAANQGGYLMPTGFTPNNDGLNDCYGIKRWGIVHDIEFSIFNRWGERVFYSRNASGCWNGKVNGVMQDPGVFIYMIRAKTNCNPAVFRKGTFVLIR